MKKTIYPNFKEVHGNLPGNGEMRWTVPVIAIFLGISSVIAALAICFVTYNRTLNSNEKRYQQFYLEIARILAEDCNNNVDHSEQESLANIEKLWGEYSERPEDAYICVVDRNSNLILHTGHPSSVGNYAGDNRLSGGKDGPNCSLSQLPKMQNEYVGAYVSSSGENQVAAFVTIPNRNWVIGVHRSREALVREVESAIKPLLNAMIVVCGLLLPVSMFLLFWTFNIARHKNRLAEREREKLLKTLSSKNKELQSVVYIASHDLKSPLVNIVGFSDMLSENCKQLKDILKGCELSDDISRQVESLTEESIPESLDFISASANKMKMLLDGLLLVSRVGTTDINIEPVDVNDIVNNVCKSMEFQFKEKGVDIVVDELPCCLGDKKMVDQLFSNLVGNAVKYLDPDRKGKIHISGTIVGNKSVYCVEDNGIGIDSGYQLKVFELFNRLNPDDSIGGEGIGLTIVTRILERNNGSVRIESEEGKGCKFFVSLPKD